ncbi:MAG: AAA family ATPase [Candidatus Heimdallarchaeota archaeon]|nr:AAA family ATPase [Candidatus Heimdallarchaeota archaeon]
MGQLDKQVFTNFAEFECDRQVYLQMGRDDPAWVQPPHKVKLSPRIRRRSPLIKELGKRYEQKVYRELTRFPITRFNRKQQKIVKTTLTKKILTEVYDDLINSNNPINFCLLEHEFQPPQAFFEELLGERFTNNLKCSKTRPDILLIGNKFSSSNEFELLPNGQEKEVKQSENSSPRFGINLYDIKNTNELHVGKKHFIEIIYYAQALSHFIYDEGLHEKFYVRISHNGIVPNLDDLFFSSLADLRDKAVELNWSDAYPIFSMARNHLQEILRQRPKDITDKNSLEFNITPSCGRCSYVNDCKHILGFGHLPPRDWDTRLLPNTSMGISQQLREKQLLTIGSLADKIDSFPISSIPNPINPELPLIKTKSKAISSNQEYYPKEGEIYSLAIPKFTELNLTFVNEFDPTIERVYAIGFRLNMTVFPKPNYCYKELFDLWWKIWRTHLEQGTTISEVTRALNDILFEDISKKEVREFAEIIAELWNNSSNANKEAKILLPEDPENRSDRTFVDFAYTYINGGMDDANEAQLAKNLVTKLYQIVKICSFLEYYITSEPLPDNDFITTPTLAIFYWSFEQLEVLEELLERNLAALIADPKIKPFFEELMNLFTPSESGVRSPFQRKKLYDLRAFAETIVGIPNSVINYTWHGIAKQLLGTMSSNRFWMPHFNYMEIIPWHEYLCEYDTNKKHEQQQEICRQLHHKLRTINSLRIEFQKHARALVSKKTRPVESQKVTRQPLPKDFHPLANIWYIYSRLNGAIEEYEADYFRTMFPDFSIGKLAAAEVTAIEIEPFQAPRSTKYIHTFRLEGLSSNMKISEGSLVLMLPNKLRDISYGMWGWSVVIDQMSWETDEETNETYYQVITEPKSNNLLEQAKEELGAEPEKWFLYPFARDFWSSKLYNNNRKKGLLQKCHFGNSWLGHRLANRLGFNLGKKLSRPTREQFNLPEIYLFAPEFLPRKRPIPTTSLQTAIDPHPDHSQQKAIQFALNSTVSMIIGPPGTGKSQTIAALIDEYLLRNPDKPVRILVSAFSYHALQVVLEKLENSRDTRGNKTPAATIQKVFLRSSSREPNSLVKQSLNIKDLTRHYGWKLDGQGRIVTKSSCLDDHLDDRFVLFGNAHQLFHLGQLTNDGNFKCFNDDFYFDFIVVDEASQLPVDHFLACLQFVKKETVKFTGMNGLSLLDSTAPPEELAKYLSRVDLLTMDEITKVVIVGDHNQLPPVQQIKPPTKLKDVLSSLFVYYTEALEIETRQLEINYRSNEQIVEYTGLLGLYRNLSAFQANAEMKIEGQWQQLTPQWLREVMDPDKVISTLIHNQQYDMSISPLEAEITTKLILGYYEMKKPTTRQSQRTFWQEKVGIVAPHNAHGRLIIRKIFRELQQKPSMKLSDDELMNALKAAIVSVEKFQGSDRDLIIATIGLSDKDKLAAEEEFIYDLNRFNVLTSRAKAKVILICSRNYLEYLPKSREVMEYSSKIRFYGLRFCNESEKLQLTWNNQQKEEIEFRWRK